LDKRTVIALLIIALIFILLPYYWEWTGMSKKPAPVAVDSTAVVDTSDSAAAADQYTPPESPDTEIVTPPPSAMPPGPIAAEAISSADTLPEHIYDVVTDLYEAQISSRGGAVASFRLNNFDYFRGTSVDMIPDRKLYPLIFRFPDVPDFSSAQLSFRADREQIDLTGGGADSAVMRLSSMTADSIPVTILYTFRRNSYSVGMQVQMERRGEFRGASRFDLEWIGGLDPTEEKLSDDYGYFSGYVRQGGEVAKFQDFEDGRLQEGSTGGVDWVATKSKYFLVALRTVDTEAEEFTITATERKTVEKGQDVAKRVFNIGLGERLSGSIDTKFELYIGPVDYHILSGLGHDLKDMVELGWGPFQPFAIAILWFITALHSFIPNYGWVIIAFTVVMKLVLFPLSRKNYTQMAKMKALQPKLKALQEKYKEDPQQLNKQMMKFYKEEKFNPLGGCMWMLPQLPIFWALFTVFKAAIELRGEGFLWIEDLSQASIALAVIMSAAMLLQQMLVNKDPKQKFMVYGFPVLMFFLFKGFPAGLVLYWTVYNLLSIVEQKSVEAAMAGEAKTAAAS